MSGIAVLLTLSLSLAACGAASSPSPGTSTGGTQAPSQAATPEPTPVRGGTLRIGTATDLLTLDLPNYVSSQDLQVGDLIFDTLVGYDPNLELVPRLAESWDQPDDETYVFTLRPDVVFTDGNPVTAEAVKAHFDRARADQRQSHYLSSIDTIEVTGDLEITFHLKGPFAPFLHFIALGVGGVSSPDSLGPTEDMARNPVGTGPFKLASWEGSTAVLEPNPDYWGTPALLERVEFRYIADESTRLAALEAGEVDVIQNVAPSEFPTLEDRGVQALLTPYAQTFWLGFTAGSSPILDNVKVRQAIAMTVDRSAIVEGVTEGLTRESSGFLPPELGVEPATPIARDVDGARALLAEAGYPDGFDITLSTPIGRYLKDVEISEVIQSQLADIDINISIESLEYAGFADKMRAHQTQMFVLGWRMQASPDPYFRAVFLSTSTSNWSNYNDPTIDAALADAAEASSIEESFGIYHDMDQQLVDDAAGVPIYYTNNLTGVADGVHDLIVDPLGNYVLWNTWVE